jgi:RNA polymerase-binding transcription factor DksA
MISSGHTFLYRLLTKSCFYANIRRIKGDIMAGEKKKQTSKAVSKSTAKETTQRSAPKPKVDWQAFTEDMEQSLLGLKAEIVGNLIAGDKDFKEIVEGMDPKDFADIASDDIDRKMIEVIGAQELKQLRLIDSALNRINQGKYGYCIKCEKRIPPDRLEALPYALMCVDCKSEEERRNR